MPQPNGDGILMILGVTSGERIRVSIRRNKAAAILGVKASYVEKLEEPLLEGLAEQILAAAALVTAQDPGERSESQGERTDSDFPGVATSTSISATSLMERVAEEPGGTASKDLKNDGSAVVLGSAPQVEPSEEGAHRRVVFYIVTAAALIAAVGTGLVFWISRSTPVHYTHLPAPDAISQFGSSCPSVKSTADPLPPSSVANPLSVRLLAQPAGSRSWYTFLAPVHPAATVRYLLSYRNGSNHDQDQVVLRTNLAPLTLLVPGSTCLYDDSHPGGLLIRSNAVSGGGINVGNFGPGAAAYLLFSVSMPLSGDIECGDTSITTVGVARPQGMDEFVNSARIDITRSCSVPSSNQTALEVSQAMPMHVTA
jgi:hypothetical protein